MASRAPPSPDRAVPDTATAARAGLGVVEAWRGTLVPPRRARRLRAADPGPRRRPVVLQLAGPARGPRPTRSSPTSRWPTRASTSPTPATTSESANRCPRDRQRPLGRDKDRSRRRGDRRQRRRRSRRGGRDGSMSHNVRPTAQDSTDRCDRRRRIGALPGASPPASGIRPRDRPGAGAPRRRQVLVDPGGRARLTRWAPSSAAATTAAPARSCDRSGSSRPRWRAASATTPTGHPMNLFTTRQYPRILRQLATYAWLSQVRYRRVNSPGLAGVDHDLHAPFAQFCRSHGLSAMESRGRSALHRLRVRLRQRGARGLRAEVPGPAHPRGDARPAAAVHLAGRCRVALVAGGPAA